MSLSDVGIKVHLIMQNSKKLPIEHHCGWPIYACITVDGVYVLYCHHCEQEVYIADRKD